MDGRKNFCNIDRYSINFEEKEKKKRIILFRELLARFIHRWKESYSVEGVREYDVKRS